MTSLHSIGLSLSLVLPAIGCGPTYVASDSGDGDGSGGAQAGTGGTTACDVDADCALAADLNDPCFSPDCSHPLAVSKDALAADPCLAAWDERSDVSAPQECAASGGGDGCPALCALPIDCPTAACDDGVCSVKSDPLAVCSQ